MELHLEIYWSTRNDFTDDIFHACHMKCWSHKFCVTFSLFTCGGGTGGGGGDGCWMRSFLILLCLVRASVSVCVCLSQMNWIHIDRINFIFRNFENPTTVGAKMAMICMRCDYVFFFSSAHHPITFATKIVNRVTYTDAISSGTRSIFGLYIASNPMKRFLRVAIIAIAWT